jgi:hypothetical protein
MLIIVIIIIIIIKLLWIGLFSLLKVTINFLEVWTTMGESLQSSGIWPLVVV